jgi:hypothetical protein
MIPSAPRNKTFAGGVANIRNAIFARGIRGEFEQRQQQPAEGVASELKALYLQELLETESTELTPPP